MTAKPSSRNPKTGIVSFQGRQFAGLPGETVLDTLLRNDIDAPYSCRKGTCLSCLMRTDSDVPAAARDGLKPTLVDRGYFLPCICTVTGDIEVTPADRANLYIGAEILGIDPLAPRINSLRLRPERPLDYRAGQFINLRRADGLTRSYSIARIPDDGDDLELHVKKLEGGRMSSWIADGAQVGEAVEIQGANGDCYYMKDNLEQPLLLIGNGAGLAPLIAIIRQALADGHRAPITLYHGSRHSEGLYLREQLDGLAREHENFRYVACISGGEAPADCEHGRAEEVAFGHHANLAGMRVFLCGYPPMVHTAKTRAYLMGAAIDDILFDAFELRELRQEPRD